MSSVPSFQRDEGSSYTQSLNTPISRQYPIQTKSLHPKSLSISIDLISLPNVLFPACLKGPHCVASDFIDTRRKLNRFSRSGGLWLHITDKQNNCRDGPMAELSFCVCFIYLVPSHRLLACLKHVTVSDQRHGRQFDGLWRARVHGCFLFGAPPRHCRRVSWYD